MLLDVAPALSSLTLGAAKATSTKNASVRPFPAGLARPCGGRALAGGRTWQSVRRQVSGRARLAAVAELFPSLESEVLGEDGEDVEEKPAVVVKPKTGKAALLLKRDRVSASPHPTPRFNLPFCNVVIECNFELQNAFAWAWRCQCCTSMWGVSSICRTHFVVSISTWKPICQVNWHST